MAWHARKITQPSLKEVTQFFYEAKATAVAAITHESHATVDGDHGRIATRRYGITSAIESLGAKPSWAKWPSIGMVESCRLRRESSMEECRKTSGIQVPDEPLELSVIDHSMG